MRNSSALMLAGKRSDTSSLKGVVDICRGGSLHLSLVVAGILPPIQLQPLQGGTYGSAMVPVEWYSSVELNAKELSETAEAFEDKFREEDIEAHIRVLCSEKSDLKHQIARRALTNDFVIMANDLRQDISLFETLVDAAIFGSSAGVLLNATDAPRALTPNRVLVAWNYRPHTESAVRAALPILRDAAEVILALFDPVMSEHIDGENPGSDVARWLSHHGCKVSVQQMPSGGMEIAKAIEIHATENAADLVVMGAYDRSRMREIVFGGTTQTMLRQTRLPVLFAH